jgi:uncharacterized RDD family membrane protein YckC
MYCSKCGATLLEGAAFCTACGQPAGVNAASVAAPSMVPAGLGDAAAVPSTVWREPGTMQTWAPAVGPSVLYAGFWLRVVAAIIDSIALAIPFTPIVFLLFAGMVPAIMHSADPVELVVSLLPRILLLTIFSAIASWLYWSLMESSSWQATLGKKALGLYVTDMQGRRASFGRTSGRYCAGRLVTIVPSIGGLYFFVSCICAGFTEKKQAIHDIIAGCLVLRKV